MAMSAILIFYYQIRFSRPIDIYTLLQSTVPVDVSTVLLRQKEECKDDIIELIDSMRKKKILRKRETGERKKNIN
jgi:hypothetical protein